MFPSYLPHEYVLSNGGNFRFIHFNITMSNLLLNVRFCMSFKKISIRL